MKKWFQMVMVSLVAFGSLAVAMPVLATTPPAGVPPVPCAADPLKDPLALDCVSTNSSGLSGGDPRLIAARIINVVLGVLGTIATVLVFYAGFLWMTAAGDDEQIGKAKSIMTAAIIGLVVILASYSISTFFVKSAYQAVNNTTYQTP